MDLQTGTQMKQNKPKLQIRYAIEHRLNENTKWQGTSKLKANGSTESMEVTAGRNKVIDKKEEGQNHQKDVTLATESITTRKLPSYPNRGTLISSRPRLYVYEGILSSRIPSPYLARPFCNGKLRGNGYFPPAIASRRVEASWATRKTRVWPPIGMFNLCWRGSLCAGRLIHWV